MNEKGKLDTISNIVVIVVGIALAVMIGRNLWLHRNANNHVAVGEKMHSLSGYAWDKHNQTLIIAVRNGCPYCNASKPFYSTLLDKQAAGRLKADILFLHLQPKSVADGEWSSFQNRAPFLYGVSLPSIGITGTPTLVLVNQAGIIQNVWLGVLDKASEKDMLAKVIVCDGCDAGG